MHSKPALPNFIALNRPHLLAKLALLLLGLTCVFPFLSPVFRPPIPSFYGEVVALALGLLAIALMASRALWTDMRLPRASILFLGFAMLMALQIALGRVNYGQLNLLGAVYVLWAAALAMLANRLTGILGAAALVTGLSWFLTAGALLSALIGLMQLLGVASPLAPLMLPQLHGRIYANTGQPNHLANYLFLGLASTGYLWSTRRLSLVPALILCLSLFAVLVVSGSRTVWLYAVAFVVLSLAMRMSRQSAEIRRLLVFSIFVFAGLVLVQWAVAGLLPQRSTAVETMGARIQSLGLSSPTRLRFWDEAQMMFRDAPVLGVGFRQYAWNRFLLAEKLPASGYDEGIVDHAHNLVFQTAAEFGIVGLVILFGGLAWWGWSVRGALIDAPRWWMAAVLAVLGLHSMLEYPLWYAYFLGIAAIVMGAIERDAPKVNDGPGGRLILIAAVMLGALSSVNVYRDYRVMQSLQRNANSQAGAAAQSGEDRRLARTPELTRTSGLIQAPGAVLIDLQRNSLFTPYVEHALARRMLLNREHLADKLELNRRAMQFQPSNDFAYRQALLLAMTTDVEDMRRQWDLAVSNYPGYREEAIRVARALENTGESGMNELLRHASARQAEKDRVEQ